MRGGFFVVRGLHTFVPWLLLGGHQETRFDTTNPLIVYREELDSRNATDNRGHHSCFPLLCLTPLVGLPSILPHPLPPSLPQVAIYRRFCRWWIVVDDDMRKPRGNGPTNNPWVPSWRAPQYGVVVLGPRILDGANNHCDPITSTVAQRKYLESTIRRPEHHENHTTRILLDVCKTNSSGYHHSS
jgi:hypothetical protein